MSLSGIFDPEVRAYFDNHGGGSAVDDGFYLESGGDGTNISIPELGVILLKRTRVVIDKDGLIGCRYMIYDNTGFTVPAEGAFVSADKWTVCFNSGIPVLISGKAGTYEYNGINVWIPEDGTYVRNDIGEFYKPAPK